MTRPSKIIHGALDLGAVGSVCVPQKGRLKFVGRHGANFQGVLKASKRVQKKCHYRIRAEKPIMVWLWGPNAIIVLYLDPLGLISSPHVSEEWGQHGRTCRTKNNSSILASPVAAS